jgi:hypothetical protein
LTFEEDGIRTPFDFIPMDVIFDAVSPGKFFGPSSKRNLVEPDAICIHTVSPEIGTGIHEAVRRKRRRSSNHPRHAFLGRERFDTIFRPFRVDLCKPPGPSPFVAVF